MAFLSKSRINGRKNRCGRLMLEGDSMTRVQHSGVVLLVALIACSGTTINAQLPNEKADLDVISRIRDRESKQSQVREMVGYLTDVSGPRLTGSPNLKKAQQYVLERLQEWGAANAHLEGWGPFGRGWAVEGFTANMVAPTFSSLIAYPKAWSPSTNGIVRGEVVFLDVTTTAAP